MRTEFFFTESPWLILPCILLGILGAWLLYAKSADFDRKIRLLLSALRGLLITTICLLLIGILVRHLQSTKENAKALVLIDNSASMASYGSSVKQIAEQYGAILQKEGYEVAYRSFSQDSALDSLAFTESSTDLNQMLERVRSDYEGMHLADVVLLSDGIVNKGVTPRYSYYPFKVHTVAFGDTIPRVDAYIKQITTNQVAYLGNNFPIAVDILATGMQGKSTRLVVRQGTKIIHTEAIHYDKEDFFTSKIVTVAASQKGLLHFSAELEPLAVESIQQNNRKEVYIDVIDAQEKILLLAQAPHPDLKAIKAAIETNQHVEIETKIATSATDYRALRQTPYDVVILHQLPSTDGVANAYLEDLKNSTSSLFFILGTQSNTVKMNEWLGGGLQLPKRAGQFDKVAGTYNNASFQLFKLESGQTELMEKLPPLSVPFGDYQVRNPNEILLYQKLGNLKTQKPLLWVSTNQRQKVALLAGEGIWRWRLEEYAMTNKQEVVDEVLQKVIQYLSIKEDKRKFRVYPTTREVALGDKVVLKVEVYNDIYELIYGQEITIRVVKNGEETKEYQYTHTQEKPFFELSGLDTGAYQFSASTKMNGKEEIATGQFSVIENNVELQSLQADYALLKTLSDNNKGLYSTSTNWQEVTKDFAAVKSPAKLKTKDELVEMIEFKWILFLLLLLLATEWGVRKYNGQY